MLFFFFGNGCKSKYCVKRKLFFSHSRPEKKRCPDCIKSRGSARAFMWHSLTGVFPTHLLEGGSLVHERRQRCPDGARCAFADPEAMVPFFRVAPAQAESAAAVLGRAFRRWCGQDVAVASAEDGTLVAEDILCTLEDVFAVRALALEIGGWPGRPLRRRLRPADPASGGRGTGQPAPGARVRAAGAGARLGPAELAALRRGAAAANRVRPRARRGRRLRSCPDTCAPCWPGGIATGWPAAPRVFESRSGLPVAPSVVRLRRGGRTLPACWPLHRGLPPATKLGGFRMSRVEARPTAAAIPGASREAVKGTVSGSPAWVIPVQGACSGCGHDLPYFPKLLLACAHGHPADGGPSVSAGCVVCGVDDRPARPLSAALAGALFGTRLSARVRPPGAGAQAGARHRACQNAPLSHEERCAAAHHRRRRRRSRSPIGPARR